MCVLSGPEIAARIARKELNIFPFDPAAVGPNSVDLTLGRTLKVYTRPWYDRLLAPFGFGRVIDSKQKHAFKTVRIPETGYVLRPGRLYLGVTLEMTTVPDLVPCLETRSSFARLGLSAHLSAGFGDHGLADFCWTCELTVVEPLRIYPGQKPVQVFFQTMVGEKKPYTGKYQGDREPTTSRLWREG